MVISKKGEITKINVEYSNRKVVGEIMRALKAYRKFTPGRLIEKSVNVNYKFPLYVEIAD